MSVYHSDLKAVKVKRELDSNLVDAGSVCLSRLSG